MAKKKDKKGKKPKKEKKKISAGAWKKRRSCPKCGSGVRLAEHKKRHSCGKCGYYEKK